MADLSKVKVLGTEYNLKDAQGRNDLTTLLGGHDLAGLGTAAWLAVDSAIAEGGTGVATTGVIKSYVDAASKVKLEIVAVEELPEASETTMYKLYLKPNDGTAPNTKDEYITVREGTEGSYTYSWELIGSTEVDLSGYLTKNATVAGVAFGDDKAITVEEMTTALNLQALAHKASGSVTISTADGFTMDSYTPAGEITINDLTQTATQATLAKTDFTPAGTVTGTVVANGSVEVTIKDAVTKSAAALTTEAYTPAGAVTGTVEVVKSAVIEQSDAGVAVSGQVSKPGISVTPTTEGVLGSIKTAAVLPSKDADQFTAGSFTKGAAVTAATEGIITSVDGETLVFTAAATDAVMDHDATFVAPTFSEGAFNPGSAATFNSVDVVKSATAALDAAPTFTGDKFAVTLTKGDADINADFTGTEAADMKITKVEYFKQEIDTAEFTGASANIAATFAGTEVKDALVSGVTYNQASANGGTFAGTAAVLTGTINKTDKTVNVDFE